MSKSDCLQADWHRIGYQVGADGERDLVAAYNKRVEICSEHGVQAEFAAFEAGHAEGIEEFCQTDNAVKQGVRGNTKAIANNVCPEYDYPGFASAFEAGYKLNQLRDQETQARYELERLENRIYENRREINTLRRILNSTAATEQQKSNAQRRIRYLRRDSNSIRFALDDYRRRLYKYEEAAETYAELLEAEYGEYR